MIKGYVNILVHYHKWDLSPYVSVSNLWILLDNKLWTRLRGNYGLGVPRVLETESLCLIDKWDLALVYKLCPLQDLVPNFRVWAQITERILNRKTKCLDGIKGNLKNKRGGSEHLERWTGKTLMDEWGWKWAKRWFNIQTTDLYEVHVPKY